MSKESNNSKGDISHDKTNANKPAQIIKDKQPTKKTLPNLSNFNGLLKHFVGYGLAIVLIAGLGFLYYKLVINANQLKTQNSLISQELKEIQRAQESLLSQFKQELARLKASEETTSEQINLLTETKEVNVAKLQAIQEQITTEEVWRLQLSRLLYLAEQERIIGNNPNSINYLLLEADQILHAAPTNPITLELRQLITGDLSKYNELVHTEIDSIYRDLRNLEQLIPNTLEFKQSLYQGDPDSNDDINDNSSNQTDFSSRYRKIIYRFYKEISQYIRISQTNKTEQDFSHQNRELIMSSINLMISQAKNSLLRGNEELYRSIMEDLKIRIVASFRKSKERADIIKLLDELSSADIIPAELPQLESYNFLVSSP